MEEQYVSYETAVLARQKGFEQCPNEQSDYCYLDNNKELFNQARVQYSMYITRYSNYKDGKIDYLIEYYYAPTQGVLQKRLREKYNINVYVKYKVLDDIVNKDTGSINGYKFILLSCNNDEDGFNISANKSNPFVYDTYEEALEKGLIKALNLINK